MPYLRSSGGEIYHEVIGDGPPLVMLHGGFCSIETLRPQIEYLASSYRVHVPERPGHGRTPDRPGPITFAGIVTDTLAYLDLVGLASPHVLGFSDGAIAGLLLALDHGDRLSSLTAISANLDPTGLVDDEPGVPSGRLDPAPHVDAEMLAAYQRLSPDGPEHASVVIAKLLDLWHREPRIPRRALARVAVPTLVMAGDRDSIRTEHTVGIAEAIPGAQLAIVPGATHSLMTERVGLVNELVAEFLAGVDASGLDRPGSVRARR